MENTLVYEGSTDIETYQVVDTIYGGRKARVLYDGDRRAAQSGIPLDDNSDMLFDYNERCMELARELLPQKVLVIGGGACTLPTALRMELPDMELDIVELDGGLIDIAEAFFSFKPTPNTQIHVTDGRSYLEKTTKKYDLIYIDAYSETTIPKSLQTIEAATAIRRCLTDSGVVAMNIISAYHGQRSGVICRQIAGWQQEFSKLQLFPASYGYSLWLPQNFVLTAQQRKTDLSPAIRHNELALPKTTAEDLVKD